jgi:hypothetical protein
LQYSQVTESDPDVWGSCYGNHVPLSKLAL